MNRSYEPQGSLPATLANGVITLADEDWRSREGVVEPFSFRGRKPVALAFGTSGLRGLVRDITDLEAYINTRGFLNYLGEGGGAQAGDRVSLASDLRPSSDSAHRSIVRAVALAVEHAGFEVEHLGPVPTPALFHHAVQHRRPSIMVTGSHIPFDRNGIKFNTSQGEVLKNEEAGILRAVHQAREMEYARPAVESLFGDDGMFKDQAPIRIASAHRRSCVEYTRRFLDFFSEDCLRGMRIVFYQHSSVARDILVELLIDLGAQVIPKGRSETFVPIDTEAISKDKLELLQCLVDEARNVHGPIDAIVSTDGDADRPLVAGVASDGSVRFFSGDVLGMVVAEFLEARVAVVPVSANDAVDVWARARGVSVIKTRIGSPYVIEAMQQARAEGSTGVVGWESNGGFLTGSDITRNSRTLRTLLTRDAALPIVAALCSARARKLSLVELFGRLPRRFCQSGLKDNVAPRTSRALIQRFMPKDQDLQRVEFDKDGIRAGGVRGALNPADPAMSDTLDSIRQDLDRFFNSQEGFDGVAGINTVDGIRACFRNGDIAHFRPSGNAPQMRIYAVADTPQRAEAIVAAALREPDGILRRIEADTTSNSVCPDSANSNIPGSNLESINRSLAADAEAPAGRGTH